MIKEDFASLKRKLAQTNGKLYKKMNLGIMIKFLTLLLIRCGNQ